MAADSHRLPRSRTQPLAWPCRPPVTHFPSWKHKSCLSPEPLVCVPGSLPPPTPSERSRNALEGGRVQGCRWDHGGNSCPLALLLQHEIPHGQRCPFLASPDQKQLLPGRLQGTEMPPRRRGCSWLWCQAGKPSVAGGVTGALSPSPSSFVRPLVVFSWSHCGRKSDSSPDSV